MLCEKKDTQICTKLIQVINIYTTLQNTQKYCISGVTDVQKQRFQNETIPQNCPSEQQKTQAGCGKKTVRVSDKKARRVVAKTRQKVGYLNE